MIHTKLNKLPDVKQIPHVLLHERCWVSSEGKIPGARWQRPESWKTRAEIRGEAGAVFLADDRKTVIDIDACLDNAGNLKKWAYDLVKDIENSSRAGLVPYGEKSTSGHGLHFIGWSKLPSVDISFKNDEIKVKRLAGFVFLTGDALFSNSHYNLGADLTPFLEKYPPPPKTDASISTLPTNIPGLGYPFADRYSDDDLIVQIAGGRKGDKFVELFFGNGEKHEPKPHPETSCICGHHSESDLALVGILAWWSGYDSERTDRLFRDSALMRSKWDRADYSTRTLAQVFGGAA